MKIKVLRDYSGAEGTDADKNVAAGSEHIVTRARAAELVAVGLVEIVGDDEHADDVETPADKGADENQTTETEVKQEIKPIANKAAPTPRNKAAPKAPSKAPSATPKAE